MSDRRAKRSARFCPESAQGASGAAKRREEFQLPRRLLRSVVRGLRESAQGASSVVRVLRRAVWLIALHAAMGLAQQPIAFPHNTHMKLGLSCLDCHTGADIRAAAGIPSVRKCMLCHAKLAKQKPEVQKVIAYANKNIEIPWVRVYSFSPDAHVKFRHAPHYQAGITCATCHGDMARATLARRTVTHNMGTCLTCHRQKHASQDCAACHY